MDMNIILWIIVFLVVSTMEAITLQLVAIWFSIGSLVCVFLAYFGVSFPVQLIAFIIVSIISMILFRPYAMKKVNVNVIKTAPENVIGKEAVVSTTLKAPTYAGRVQVEGMDWAAITNDKKQLEEGSIVTVEAIDGVKLIVKGE